ncbi:DEKNAAC102722 [Brettanomyces naardenensis]|uniref:DEKNAAC102722 n=1 Tax=Brettanomyces naardenensis TaxID=13370 RepID=A0A448YLJ7_BRENA|nr:DEKNAAC102722 [Brettanomyces naardenensis]
MNKRPNERTVNDLFLSGNLREYLQQKNEASLRAIPNSQLNLPLHVGPYHSLYPVDKHFDKTDKSFGYLATIFKCVSNLDGRLYCMRRLEGVPITSGKFLEPIKKWKLVDSANVVKVYDAFTSKAFGDLSLITIYDYYPLSLNLMETHFYRIGNKDPELITEAILWSYIVQLTNAAMEIHNKGLFVGEFDPTKIIVTNKGRVRLSSCAIGDIVEASKDHNQFQNGNQKVEGETDGAKVIDEQKKDLERLGGLVLNLSKSTTFIKDSSTIKPMEIIDRLTFSDEFKKILRYCLTPDSTWKHFQELLAPHILEVANGFENSADYMESSLLTEVENARLVRLLCKLDVISERPEFIKDGSWSETGERYPIKLFKDYVFHQVDEAGNSVVDLTHIVNCLNKLDSGVDENVLLVSPDEMTCLVMSYKRLKELVESSFRSLS